VAAIVATKNYFVSLRIVEVDEGKITGKGADLEPPSSSRNHQVKGREGRLPLS